MDEQNNQENNNGSGQNSGVSGGDELVKCQKERDEYLDGWRRAKADLINYKKDEAKRFEAMIKFGQEALIKEVIAVLDSFDLALNSLETPKESNKLDPTGQASGKIERGIYLIRTQLEDVLRRNGLKKVEISIGQPYDPSSAEAIADVESDKPSGTIIEEVEKGYALHGKIIRPARVKISK